MNFFKSINSAVEKINSLGNLTHQKNLFGSQTDPLSDLIRICTYTEDVKWIIEKSVKQVLQVYSSFSYDKLQYVQGGQQRRFIEIKGEIQVEMRGKIRFNVMYPASFPKQAPYLRIINPNPAEYAATPHYQALQSKTDNSSFILNERLDAVKKWNSSTSVVSLVIQTSSMIKNNFPFLPAKQQQMGGNNYNQYPNQYQNQYQNQYPNNGFNANQGFNPNQNVNPNPNQYPSNRQPPIPFQAGYAVALPKAQALVMNEKKKLGEIKAKHEKSLQSIQTTDLIGMNLTLQSIDLAKESQKMKNFVDSHDDNGFRLEDIIVPADCLSQQVLDLMASIKARQDSIHMLQTKFNDEQINLDVFLKLVRKMQEGKFQEKALLIKCLQNVSRIMG